LKNKLYVSVAAFQQVKTQPQLRGAPSFIVKDNGLEVEGVYQPTQALSVNANMTYQDATAFGSGFFQETGNYLDAYGVGTIVDGKSGTGYGAVNYTTYHPYGNRMRAPGVPQLLANFFVEYKVAAGSASVSGRKSRDASSPTTRARCTSDGISARWLSLLSPEGL